MLSLVLAAVLGVPDAGFAPPPPAQEFLLAQDLSPAGSGPIGVASPPAAEGAVAPVFAPPARAAVLVDALVFEKYRSFRESLTTP
jgi:hypothetical protein